MTSPGRTALYRLYSSADQLLYVGIAEDPQARWSQHATDKAWWHEVTRRDVEWLPSQAEAEALERQAIGAETPMHNSRHAHPALSTEEARELFVGYRAIAEAERQQRELVRQAAAQELKAGATVGQLAKLTGLTPEYFRRIAREAGVERKRPPTVGKLNQG